MIPLMKSAFLNEFETREALAGFITRAPRLSMDEQCFMFEHAFAKVQARKHAVLFNSGASANLALLQAVKNMGMLKQGDQIGFSALTWSTNTMPIIQMGFDAVPIDCEPTTLNVMWRNIEETLKSSNLRAVFLTNALGFTGDLAAIRERCAERNIIVLEDNCESLGTELPQGMAGNFSLGSTFSFFVAHHMSTIEGGMICSDDDDLVEMLKMVRANGWDRNLSAVQQRKWRSRYGIETELAAKYTFYDLAFNMRPTEITGFLGLEQLKYLRDNITTREKNYLRFEAVIKENPELIQLDHSHISLLSSFCLPVMCRTPELKQKYVNRFAGAGIEIRPMIAGNMQRQPFFQKYSKAQYVLKGADFVHECGFYSGNYPELSEADIEMVSNCLAHY